MLSKCSKFNDIILYKRPNESTKGHELETKTYLSLPIDFDMGTLVHVMTGTFAVKYNVTELSINVRNCDIMSSLDIFHAFLHGRVMVKTAELHLYNSDVLGPHQCLI